MSVELILDADVLLYAVDGQSHFHTAARTWLDEATTGVERIGFPWVFLTAFQRIITHPRITADPLAPSDAWSCIADWLDTDQAWIPAPGIRHRDILSRLPADGDLRGNLVIDARLAALAIEHGTGICSFDSDFARFPDVRWINPSHQ